MRSVRVAILPYIFTAFLLFPSLWGNGQERSSRESFAKAVLASTGLGNGFNYDVAELVPITDGKSGEKAQFCYLFGGPPTSTTGAVGVFNKTGRLLDGRSLKGLYGYETNATVLTEGDSVVLRLLVASGTGLHDELFIVLAFAEGKLVEVFRCTGLRYSMHGEFYDEKVELVFRDLYGDGTREIIRLVTTHRYVSAADQEKQNASATKSTAEVFQFDTRTREYVRRFD